MTPSANPPCYCPCPAVVDSTEKSTPLHSAMRTAYPGDVLLAPESQCEGNQGTPVGGGGGGDTVSTMCIQTLDNYHSGC